MKYEVVNTKRQGHLPTYLPSFLPTYLPSFLPSYLPHLRIIIPSFVIHSYCTCTLY